MSILKTNNLSERLKFAMGINGVSQTHLAKQINTKPQIIQYLCAGNVEKSKFTFEIAEALGIDAIWLATGRGLAPSVTFSSKSDKTIPMLDMDQIKRLEVQKIELQEGSITEWINVKGEFSPRSFAIKLNDKAMSPRFDLNTIIIIDQSMDFKKIHPNNAFALVYIAKEDFVIFRKVAVIQNKKILEPLNYSLYKEIELSPKDKIIGYCKEARWSN